MDETDTLLPLTLYSLDGPFKSLTRFDVIDVHDAHAKVQAHIAGSGYSNLRTADDGDGSLRFIADPAKGRKGRNVASLDVY